MILAVVTVTKLVAASRSNYLSSSNNCEDQTLKMEDAMQPCRFTVTLSERSIALTLRTPRLD